MNTDLENLLWNAPNHMAKESSWNNIIDGLYDDFEFVIGERFERDPEPVIRSEDNQFSAWMWSQRRTSPLSMVWSGIIAGGLAKDVSGNDIMVITADVFLFHAPKCERLGLSNTKHFLQFNYQRSKNTQSTWCYLGWVKDEWKEWEDVSFVAE